MYFDDKGRIAVPKVLLDEANLSRKKDLFAYLDNVYPYTIGITEESQSLREDSKLLGCVTISKRGYVFLPSYMRRELDWTAETPIIIYLRRNRSKAYVLTLRQAGKGDA